MALQTLLENQVYPRVPVRIQNALISVQGWRYKRVRFGRTFRASLAEAEGNAVKSADELLALQLKRLQDFVWHASEQSVYYRSAFASHGVHPSDLNAISDLAKFPILEKDTLRGGSNEIQARDTKGRRDLVWMHTSGTTGTPITVAFTPADMQRRFAFLWRMLRRFGVQPGERSVRLSGRNVVPGNPADETYWRYNAPMRQLLMSSYHMQPANLDAYVRKLVSFEPAMIDGFPSTIYLLARHLTKLGMAGAIRPKLIMTTAETLEDYQREEIGAAFGGAPVANQYASSEGAPFITEDEWGDLVVNLDSGVFETDEQDNLLVTSFTTHAFPLIRYRIGDRLLLGNDRLARSTAMPVAEEIVGRQEDYIVSPLRGPIARLDPAFKRMPSTIIESQIAQTGENQIELRVVPDTTRFSQTDLDSVLTELAARLGPMQVKIRYFDGGLPRGANGKLRAVVREIGGLTI